MQHGDPIFDMFGREGPIFLCECVCVCKFINLEYYACSFSLDDHEGDRVATK